MNSSQLLMRRSELAFLTPTEPLRSSRSRTLSMSNCAYFASRTPSAMFSKSQNTARLRASGLAGTLWDLGLFSLVEPGLKPLEVEVDHRRDVQRQDLRQQHAAGHREAQRLARVARVVPTPTHGSAPTSAGRVSS